MEGSEYIWIKLNFIRLHIYKCRYIVTIEDTNLGFGDKTKTEVQMVFTVMNVDMVSPTRW